MGFGGLELRARCAGFSVTEIGNRKKRQAFLYEFPGKKPQAGFRAAAITFSIIEKNVVSEQNAKHFTIETGLC